MNEKDYTFEADNMINEGIQQGKCEWANDKTRSRKVSTFPLSQF